jgi:hypothetical protein
LALKGILGLGSQMVAVSALDFPSTIINSILLKAKARTQSHVHHIFPSSLSFSLDYIRVYRGTNIRTSTG